MMKRISVIIVFALSSYSLGDSSIDNVSFVDLYDMSDYVALVQVVEGKLRGPDSYDLRVSPVYVFKGMKGNKVSAFSYKGGFSDSPSKLGGYYLVFLEKDNEMLVNLYKGYSVVEVSKISSDRPDMDLVLERLSLDRSEISSSYEGEVWYPEVCTHGNEILCEKVVQGLKHCLGRLSDTGVSP